jgi:gliding motility-associated-like protein
VDQLHGDAPIYLRITTYTEAITATLSMPARPSFTPIVVDIPAGEFYSMDLTPYKALIESSPFNAVLNTGMLLEVTGVATAYYEVASTVNPGIFNLKGDVALGRNFFIPAQTAFVNNTSLPGRSGFVVVATEDNTQVTITPKNDMVGHPLSAGAFTITLDRGETYSALATGYDPSDRLHGSEVTSTKPITVTIFDDNVWVPGHYDLCGDQIVPIEHIGTEYIVVRGNDATNERIYVLATQNSTQVYVDGGATPVATLNRGQQYSRSFTGASHYITTSKPTYVMHMAGIGGEFGHSQMPPIGCSGVSEMGFVRTSSGQFGLMILVPTGSEDDFIINGNPSLISGSSFTTVPGTGGQWKSYYSNIGLPVGQNFVENTTANFHMGILNNLGASTVYGYYTRFGLSQPNLGPDQIACNRDLLPMTLQTRITADEYLWSDGSTGSELTVNEPGTYWVRSRAGGCTDQFDTITITNINARLLGARQFDFCGSFSVSIPTNFPGSDEGTLTVHTDSMSAVNGTSPLGSLTLTTEGTYYVRLETDCGCYTVKGIVLRSHCPPQAEDDAYTTPEDVAVNLPVLSNDSDPDGSLVPGSVTVVIPPNHGTVVVNPDGSLTYTPNIGYVGEDCFTYEVCDSLGVERDDALVCITMAEVDIIIPEVFTPNGDGFNETFEIIGIEQFPDNQLMVFNRWENLVYQADGYASQWDGVNMSNGEKLPDGTYFYVLILDPRQKESPVFKGFVAIQR